MLSYRRNFIAGRRQAPLSRLRVDVRSPFDGAWVGQAPLAGPADIEMAIRAARQAFQRRTWSGASRSHRLAVLERFWRLYAEEADDLALLSARQTALPVTAMRDLASQAQAIGATRLALARAALDAPVTAPHRHLGQPGGVVAAFPAWNATQPSALAWLLPALLAGCAVVLTLPPVCPLDGQRLGELSAEAGLPEGVLNIIVADEASGLRMAAHPEVDRVAFSGAAELAQDLARVCAAEGKPFTLDLHGRATGVLAPDADLAAVVAALRPRLFLASGQAPANPSRLLAPRHRQGELVEALSALAETLVVGDPRDPRTMIGPLISEQARARAVLLLDEAAAAGAEIVGGRPDAASAGATFMNAAVVANVSPDMSLVRCEPWAPVAAVIPYGDLDEAITLVNALPGRPSAVVWSEEPSIAEAIATRLKAGRVALNPRALAADLAAAGREREEPFSDVQIITYPEP